MTARREPARPPVLLALLLVGFVATAFAFAAVLAPPGRAAASGDLLAWAPLHLGATGDRDALFAAARGSDGSLYVCGISDQSQENGRMYVARYAHRVLLWHRDYTPPATVSASASYVAVDAAGNAIVAGQAWDGATNSLALVKFSASGAVLWSALRTGVGSFDGAGGLAVSRTGNVYVLHTGWGDERAYVVKYAAAEDPAAPGKGRELWAHALAGGGPYPSVAGYGLALDGGGNVYAAGERSSASAERNAFLLKVSPSGKRQWLRTWDGAAHKNDTFEHVVIAGKVVYVAGNTETRRRQADVVVLSYDSGGRVRWARTWDDGQRQSDNVGALQADGSGNAYVCSNVWLTGNRQKIVLCKYAASGRLLWQRSYRGVSGEGGANAGGLAVGSAGDAYVAGYLSRPAGVAGFLTVKWSAGGVRRWARAWNGPSVNPLGGQAWACILSGTSVVTVGEALTTANGSGAEVTWRRR